MIVRDDLPGRGSGQRRWKRKRMLGTESKIGETHTMVDNDGYTLAPHGVTGTSCMTPHSRALLVTFPRPLPVVLLLFMDVSFSFLNTN